MSESIRTRQEPLFVESLEEAIEATAMACGGKKAFACGLRPELADEPEKAHHWLLDALNSDRRTEIHAIHIIRACRIARDYGSHILKHWLDDTTGYERTGVAPKMSEHELLASELQQLARRATEVAAQLGEIERESKVRAVK